MIDLHCHVLPGLDDGPETIEGSLELARAAREDGTTVIAATPHIDSAFPGIDARKVRTAVARLQKRLTAACIDIRIVTGGEVSSIRAVELDDAELAQLTLGGGPWLLFECPLAVPLIPGFAGVARSLAKRGFRLLLAHPERSPLFLRKPELLDDLVAEGMLAQVTAGSLTGRYGGTPRDMALRLVRRGTAHVVASDGHGSHRPALIASELDQAGIDPALGTWLGHDVPAALLTGEDPPPRPAAAPRGARSRLLKLIDR